MYVLIHALLATLILPAVSQAFQHQPFF